MKKGYELNKVLEDLRAVLERLPEGHRQDWLKVVSLQTALLARLVRRAEARN
jgi:hypothetical protein